MEQTHYQLAQYNITKLKAPLNAPETKEFTDFLAPVNHYAEESPGFVWRLAADGGEPSANLPPIYDDPMIVTNMSVWRDIESLKQFTYQTVHAYFFRNRKKWLESAAETSFVLWWVPEGHTPTEQEGKEKLEMLQKNGPSPAAFTFQQPFDCLGNAI